jgi:aspartate-semialdehyde dehydrogenase
MQLPVDQYKFLASQRSVGKQIRFRGESHSVELLEPQAFHDVDVVIASTPDDIAVDIGKWAVDHNAIVIDESGAHRMREDVPLIVPEVNAKAIAQHQGIIASPNCSTTQMVVALKPLHDAAQVKRVIVSTYQATSGAGVPGQTELINATRARLESEPFENQAFAYDISFNCIPQIGSPVHEGYTSEEMKMVWETQKIFDDPTLQVCPTCVRVPVENCHSESILAETKRPLSAEQARELFQAAAGIRVFDDVGAGEYPMPSNCDGMDEVFVGRIRKDISCENGIAFWCVSDNLRKGAATNAVQIAELLLCGKFTPCKT